MAYIDDLNRLFHLLVIRCLLDCRCVSLFGKAMLALTLSLAVNDGLKPKHAAKLYAEFRSTRGQTTLVEVCDIGGGCVEQG